MERIFTPRNQVTFVQVQVLIHGALAKGDVTPCYSSFHTDVHENGARQASKRLRRCLLQKTDQLQATWFSQRTGGKKKLSDIGEALSKIINKILAPPTPGMAIDLFKIDKEPDSPFRFFLWLFRTNARRLPACLESSPDVIQALEARRQGFVQFIGSGIFVRKGCRV